MVKQATKVGDMSKKVVVKQATRVKKIPKAIGFSKEEIEINLLRSMTFGDLHTMFIFISGDNNKQFGGKLEAKNIIRRRHGLLLDELNRRSYGCDPYKLDKINAEDGMQKYKLDMATEDGMQKLDVITIEGEMPENIDLSKFDKKGDE